MMEKIKKGIFFCEFFLIFILCNNKNPVTPITLHPSDGKIILESAKGYYKDSIFYDSTGDTINIFVKLTAASKINKAELFIKDPQGVMTHFICWARETQSDTVLWKTPIIFNCAGGRFAELVMNLDDGTTKKYLQTIAIKPKPLKLMQLTVDSVKIKPLFSDTIYTYTAEVNYNVEQIGITAYFMGEGCNYIFVKSNYKVDTLWPSVKKKIKLNYGFNIFEIISKPKNDTNKLTYFLNIFRRGGRVDSLWFTFNKGYLREKEDSLVLLPPFHRDSMKYELKLPYEDSVITLTVKEMYDSDLIFINDENVKEKTFTFPGGISKVTIKVVSHDKKDSVEYRVFVERKQSDEARLKNIVVSPVGMVVPLFTPDTKDYVLIIPDSTYEITLVPIPLHRKAEVEINGSKSFVSTIYLNSHTDTLIKIKVTSESKSKEEEYKILIQKRSSDIALIEKVELSTGELFPHFHRDTLNYEIRVLSSTDSIKIKPFRVNINSEVKIENSIVLPDSFSGAIAIAYGKTTVISMTVTSESGFYQRKYNFIVNRPYVLNVSSNYIEAGTVEPVGSFEVFADSIVLLRAFPNDGYRFVKWMVKEGDVLIEDENSSSTKVRLMSNASILGEFETIPKEEKY